MFSDYVHFGNVYTVRFSCFLFHGVVLRVLDEMWSYRKSCTDGCETRHDVLFLLTDGAPTDDVKDDGHAPSNGSVTTFYRRKHIDFILKLQQTEITKKVNQQSAACEGYTTRILCAKGLEGGDVCTGDSVKCQQQKKTACTHFLSLYCVSFIGRTSVQVGLELCD